MGILSLYYRYKVQDLGYKVNVLGLKFHIWGSKPLFRIKIQGLEGVLCSYLGYIFRSEIQGCKSGS